jgi:hypothetical protein
MPAMADSTSPTTPLPLVGQTAALALIRPSDLRLVLFGLPAAGKSSLLGALAQAAQTQEHLLHGRLVPRTDGLVELQKRLYVENPRPTAEEVAPYPVEFDPFGQDGHPGGKLAAVLIDCDGRVANDLLARRSTLPASSVEGTLAHEVIEADTLILVVDAAAPPVQVDAEFAEFGRFLRLLELGRGQRSEVGGLPVFLVLTKCDLLAQPSDTNVDWLERIEERKRQVHHRFQDFLARRGRDDGPLPFGRIDLHLWATAVKRPALGPAPPRPRDPYGVAELFRQSLESAQAFRQRQARSGRRLLWTVGGAVGVLAGMAVLALALVFGRHPEPNNQLLSKVENYQSNEGQTPSVRLRGNEARLQARIGELTELKNDPGFEQLPPDTREYVTNRLQELEAYRSYLEKLLQVQPVATARSEADLKQIEDQLTALEPPEAYRTAWSQTDAVHDRKQRLEDVKALRTAVGTAEDWYNGLKREGERLLNFPVDRSGGWGAWYDEYSKLDERATAPPFREDAPLPGSAGLTWAVALRFNRVAEARGAWQTTRQRLDRARDLAAAFRLIGPVPDRPALLVIPAPPEFTVQDARARLADLGKAYPRFREDFRLTDLGGRIAGALGQAARGNYRHLLDAGRAAVLRRLQQASPDGKETVGHWREVRRWLQDPEELTAWRTLAGILGPMQGPDWQDPVEELARFLGRDQFDLDLKKLSLEIPLSLNVRPAGRLTVYHQPAGGSEESQSLQVGEPEIDQERRVRIYPVRPEGSPRVLVYRPGDGLWANLPVEYRGSGDWLLDWIVGRSAVYQFGHLSQAPLLRRKDQDSSQGESTAGVELRASPGSTLPAVPELMPVVKLEKQ